MAFRLTGGNKGKLMLYFMFFLTLKIFEVVFSNFSNIYINTLLVLVPFVVILKL